MFPTTQVLVISGVLAAPLPRVWRTPSTWTTFDVPLRSRTRRCCLCILLGLEHRLFRLITMGLAKAEPADITKMLLCLQQWSKRDAVFPSIHGHH